MECQSAMTPFAGQPHKDGKEYVYKSRFHRRFFAMCLGLVFGWSAYSVFGTIFLKQSTGNDSGLYSSIAVATVFFIPAAWAIFFAFFPNSVHINKTEIKIYSGFLIRNHVRWSDVTSIAMHRSEMNSSRTVIRILYRVGDQGCHVDVGDNYSVPLLDCFTLMTNLWKAMPENNTHENMPRLSFHSFPFRHAFIILVASVFAVRLILIDLSYNHMIFLVPPQTKPLLSIILAAITIAAMCLSIIPGHKIELNSEGIFFSHRLSILPIKWNEITAISNPTRQFLRRSEISISYLRGGENHTAIIPNIFYAPRSSLYNAIKNYRTSAPR